MGGFLVPSCSLRLSVETDALRSYARTWPPGYNQARGIEHTVYIESTPNNVGGAHRPLVIKKYVGRPSGTSKNSILLFFRSACHDMVFQLDEIETLKAIYGSELITQEDASGNRYVLGIRPCMDGEVTTQLFATKLTVGAPFCFVDKLTFWYAMS